MNIAWASLLYTVTIVVTYKNVLSHGLLASRHVNEFSCNLKNKIPYLLNKDKFTNCRYENLGKNVHEIALGRGVENRVPKNKRTLLSRELRNCEHVIHGRRNGKPGQWRVHAIRASQSNFRRRAYACMWHRFARACCCITAMNEKLRAWFCLFLERRGGRRWISG